MKAQSGVTRRRFLRALTTAAAMSGVLRNARATEEAAWRGECTHSGLKATDDAAKTYLDRIYTRVLRFS
jgi:hypothetical protein